MDREILAWLFPESYGNEPELSEYITMYKIDYDETANSS